MVHGEILGRLEVGWKKMALWSTKAAISLKHVKIEGKLLWRAYRNWHTLFRMVPFPIPYAPFSRLEVRSPHPKLQSLLSQERVKLRTFWPIHSQGSFEQKPIKNFAEKAAWVYPGTVQFFAQSLDSYIELLSQERVKLRISNFERTFIGSIWTKSPLKISGKVAVDVVRDSRKFSGHPYIGRIARSSLLQLIFFVRHVMTVSP